MTGHIWVYGIIGDKPKGASEKYYSFQDFRGELNPEATDYTVHIFSPGGDVFQGAAIYNGLKNTGKPIKVLIEGVCASIATLIAGAADPGKLIMNAQSQWMVHNPKFNNISGDAQELRTGADQLDQIKTLLINIYRKRTGLSEQALWDVLNRETWMLPEQAKQLGFVDEVVESMKAVAYADLKFLDDMENNTVMEALKSLEKKIMGLWRPKNMSVTLADGTVLVVASEDGEWVGKQVAKEDGTPLEPGSYPLTDGRILVVGDQSTISEVQEAKTEEPAENQEDMKAKEELEKAQARIKELESALEATKNSAQESNALVEQEKAKVKTLENKINTDIKNLTDELNKIKNTTAGDDSKPDLGVKKQFNDGKQPVLDPMQQWFKTNILDKRNTD
jgi:ATP-dependent protease ClpP protease subunit